MQNEIIVTENQILKNLKGQKIGGCTPQAALRIPPRSGY